MKTFKTILAICCFCLVFYANSVFSQKSEKPTGSPLPTPSEGKRTDNEKAEPSDYFSQDETTSPFRYVVVYENVRFEDEGEKVPVSRFVQVLVEKRAFNKANLIYLFKYLAKYYASPAALEIEVHTSLKTLETFEESLAISTHSGRDPFIQFYRTASYSRFEDGTEGFLYDTGRPGKFVRKWIRLPKTTKK